MSSFWNKEIHFNVDGTITTSLYLTSFLKTSTDKFIYGYYFALSGLQRFDISELKHSCAGVMLPNTTQFADTFYIETYNNLNCIPSLLGISTIPPAGSSLQYSHDGYYYSENLQLNGIVSPTDPAAKQTGLSRSLKQYVNKCQ